MGIRVGVKTSEQDRRGIIAAFVDKGAARLECHEGF